MDGPRSCETMKARSQRFQSGVVLPSSPIDAGYGSLRWPEPRNPRSNSGLDAGVAAAQAAPDAGLAVDFPALLRVAWLPTEGAFVRAIQLPSGDPAEIQALVEFQAGSHFPSPVNQITWTAVGVMHPDGQQQRPRHPGLTVQCRRVSQRTGGCRICSGPDRPAAGPGGPAGAQPSGDGLWLIFESSGISATASPGGSRRRLARRHPVVGRSGTNGAPALASQLGQIAWAGEMDEVGSPASRRSTSSQIPSSPAKWADSQRMVRAIPSSKPRRPCPPRAGQLHPLPEGPGDPASGPCGMDQHPASEGDGPPVDGRTGGAGRGLHVVFVFAFLIALNIRTLQDSLRSGSPRWGSPTPTACSSGPRWESSRSRWP